MLRVNTSIGRSIKKNASLRVIAELRDEDLFKDPPPMEDCHICFLPMPDRILSLPIVNFAGANQKADKAMEVYYSCCGKKTSTKGVYTPFFQSGNYDKCLFCNSDQLKNHNKRLLRK